MYAIPNSNRIYSFILLCLCSAFFSSAALASDGYWSTYEKRVLSQSEVSNRVNRILSQATSVPQSTTIRSTTAPTVTTTKNSLGGLSTKTNSILSTMGGSSPMSSTAGYSADKVRGVLVGCLTNKVCASRYGTAGILAAGVNGWMEVYNYMVEPDGSLVENVPYDPVARSLEQAQQEYPNGRSFAVWDGCPSTYFASNINYYIVGGNLRVSTLWDCWGVPLSEIDPEEFEGVKIPVITSQLESNIDTYNPDPSDVNLFGGDLISQEPDVIFYDDLETVQLSEQTKTVKNANGDVVGTEVTTNELVFEVQNNGTANPSISAVNNSTTLTYDSTGNVTGSVSSSDVILPSPAPGPVVSTDFELPSFCSWASIVCEWVDWTKEGIDGEEPDLINLISDFEPDENQYNSGIGAGSCPAPMSLNLGIINRTVEVSYQPFCDFLDMIRPLVIAGAWLLSAFMYVGVLRRG